MIFSRRSLMFLAATSVKVKAKMLSGLASVFNKILAIRRAKT